MWRIIISRSSAGSEMEFSWIVLEERDSNGKAEFRWAFDQHDVHRSGIDTVSFLTTGNGPEAIRRQPPPGQYRSRFADESVKYQQIYQQ